ncbi:hypothetical protein FD755_001195 [Muntiacus reevesi]|uniref:Peroxiredoxin-1 n=1 Tax=Muntiacus reevesi TaxID=9886 RepID=A0A5J5N3K7_MUNRE|nr:hypothetical protein FD755_001195 [Muntiacus reevesi]
MTGLRGSCLRSADSNMSSGNAANGLRAPQFKAIVVMPDDQCKDISLSDYREKYAVFFFYPLDFTFVYPMEIIAFSDRAEELKKLNCWSFLVKQGGLGPVNTPLISDPRGTIAQDHGTTTNDLPVGHCVDETLRLVQSGSDTIKSDVQKSKEYFSK